MTQSFSPDLINPRLAHEHEGMTRYIIRMLYTQSFIIVLAVQLCARVDFIRPTSNKLLNISSISLFDNYLLLFCGPFILNHFYHYLSPPFSHQAALTSSFVSFLAGNMPRFQRSQKVSGKNLHGEDQEQKNSL